MDLDLPKERPGPRQAPVILANPGPGFFVGKTGVLTPVACTGVYPSNTPGLTPVTNWS